MFSRHCFFVTSLAGSWVTKFKKFFGLSNCEALEISRIYFS